MRRVRARRGEFRGSVVFMFRPGERLPLEPTSPGPSTQVKAPAIDVSGMGMTPPARGYNRGKAAVYPAGLAISSDGTTLFTANNLGDTLGVVPGPGGGRVPAALPQP